MNIIGCAGDLERRYRRFDAIVVTKKKMRKKKEKKGKKNKRRTVICLLYIESERPRARERQSSQYCGHETCPAISRPNVYKIVYMGRWRQYGETTDKRTDGPASAVDAIRGKFECAMHLSLS